MNNTNKELEINPTVLLDQAKMIERMVDIDDYKEAEDIFFQMLDSYREQGVKEERGVIRKKSLRWYDDNYKHTPEHADGSRTVITEKSFDGFFKALTNQEDQLIVKE